MTRYAYTWFNKSAESQCKCLTLSSAQAIYCSWNDIVYDMNDSLRHAEVPYKLNENCNPKTLQEEGEMIYATYGNNYGVYIVKVVVVFD